MSSLKDHTDVDLLLLLTQNDDGAFSELYNRYAPMVRSIAFSKTNSIEGAQEIVQEIFLSMWERRASLKVDTLSNYLIVAVKYQVINYIKRQLRDNKYATYYKTFVKVSGEETLRVVEYKNLTDALEHGVQRLPKKTQVVFKLNRLEGKSIAEIADELKLSEKAIKYHITRSLKELKFYLKEFMISSSILMMLLE